MTTATIQLTPSQRIYAIGDIHGRLDLLERAIAAVRGDVERHGPADFTVTVGDYIDRGPQSRGVLDRLAENPFPTSYVALKGNHEGLLEAFMADPELGPFWAEQGGFETLRSYGVAISPLARNADFVDAARQLRAALPAAHVDFLRSLQTSFTCGPYFFCHAGVRPGLPLDRQSEDDLLWIRDEFLLSRADFGKIVVHGHTPVVEPEVLPNRIGIDTGAFASGRLTCVALDAAGWRFLPVQDRR
jgi:diadenosine tetraphosphatase ApaH/serine/threonine PP2A family protein phosphatase